MRKAVRLGIIGCGRATERLYEPAFRRFSDIEIVAVGDHSAERRKLLAACFGGAEAYDSAEALLDLASIDGVIIATPPETHIPIAQLAVRHRIPVLIEKPLAPSNGKGRGLESIALERDSIVMLGFNRRYWAPVHQLRKKLHIEQQTSDIHGELVISGNPEGWAAIEDGTDALDDQGCHQLDLVRYLWNREITAVSAQWKGRKTIAMRLSLEGGGVANCIASHETGPGESIIVECSGRTYEIRRGSERIHPPRGQQRAVLDFVDTWRRRALGRQSSLRRSYVEQFRRFADAIRSGATPEPGLSDGLAAFRAARAARLSADNGGMEVGLG